MGRKLKEQEEIVKTITDEMESKQKTLEENGLKIKSLQQQLKDKGNESVLSNKIEEKCYMCFEPFDDQRRRMCFINCGHTRMCKGCYHELKERCQNQKPKKRLECPECRVEIKQAQIAFL